MDRLYFVDVKPSIDRKETTSIKDAIFRRAREKAQELADEKNGNYTSDVKNDVMDIARETISASPMNPFNQFMESLASQNSESEEVVQESDNFPDLTETFNREVKHNIESASNDAFVKSIKDETMLEARRQFRTNLNITLNFLNTQAAIRAAESTHSKINRALG